MEPNFPISNTRMKELDEILGDYEDARQQAIAFNPAFSKIPVQPGKQGYWRAILDFNQQKTQLSGEDFFVRITSAQAWAQLGDREKAFQWLKKSYDAQDDLLPEFAYSPIFDSLHADPRYPALLKNLGLPE
jgi:hypothetical protein